MAIHTVRDYITQNTASVNRQFIAPYLLAIFLRRILGYSYVGDTNFPINSVGTLLIATADSTPTVAPTFAAGTKAGINQGTSREFYVWIPPSVRTVQLADVGRLLVLRSTANPTFNSGIYLITGFESLTYTVQSTSGTGSNPTTITTTTNHTLTTGQTITLSGVTGNTAANGTWTITVTGSNTFTIPVTSSGTGSAGSAVANSYIIDYRTMGTLPPQEAFDSMNWYLYDKDANCPVNGAPNAGWPSTYGGNGTSTTSRIILQSPHSLQWQVRICNETDQDWVRNLPANNGTGSVSCCTAMPGFGGNSFGDFAVGGPHLHTGIFYSGQYNAGDFGGNTIVGGNCPGFSEPGTRSFPYLGTAIPYRMTLVGDDTGQGVVLFGRRQFDATNPKSYMLAFGVPENEPSPLPVNNAARLFILGGGTGTNNNDFNGNANDISLSMGTSYAGNNNYNESALCQGISQSTGGIPCSCATAVWTYGTGSAQFGSPGYDGSAADSPWSNATELLLVDLINGTTNSWNGSTAATAPANGVLPYEPRIIGTLPHIRYGRTNFDEFATTNDPNRSWQHMRRGVYVTWNGPQVVP
jgi:hypothetical protein